MKVVETSGDMALDRPAWGSIAGSNPFPPLPIEFKGPSLGLRFTFYYNETPTGSLISPHTQAERIQTSPPPAQKQSSSAAPELATEALSLYREGRFDEAAQRYQRLLQMPPISADAYIGLTRVYLRQKKVREAHETISKGLAVADSPTLRVAHGEVLFREGKLTEAEQEWLSVINSGHADARAHLGLARLSIASTQYKQAKTEIDEAHRLDLDDPDIQFYWIRSQGLGAGLRDSNHDCRLATPPAAAIAPAKLMLFGGLNHKGYLGCLNCSEYVTDSVFNKFVSFGSEFSSGSIWNTYSEFASHRTQPTALQPIRHGSTRDC
jgi:tetratricopeptide (TPR) repeat protein